MARGNSNEDDQVTLRKSTLLSLGLFIKDFVTGDTIPSLFWTSLGHSVTEMHGDDWLEKVHPEDRVKASNLREATIFQHSSHMRESFRIIDAHGEYHWVLSTGIVDEWLPAGKPRRYVGLDVDVTEIHELQESLRGAQEVAEVRAMEAETLRTAGAVIASSLDTYDAVGRVLGQLESLVRIDTAIVFEKQERDNVPILVREEPSQLERYALDFFSTEFGRTTLNEVMRNKTLDVFREPSTPSRFWMIVPLVVAAGTIGVLALSRSDGNEFAGHETRFAMSIGDFLAIAMRNAALYKRMSTLASTDQLSGLMTRHAFFAQAEQLYRDLMDSGSDAACLILDVDHFKQVNDNYGHLAGDQALRTVADTFRRNLRDNDLVCRFGGEEFCALLPKTTGDDAREVAERVCTAIAALDVPKIGKNLTVSIGVAGTATGGFDTLDRLIQVADEALYAAKTKGRNRVEVAGQFA